jgi:hypothetical protein
MADRDVWKTVRKNWLAVFLIVLAVVLFLLFSGYLAG